MIPLMDVRRQYKRIQEKLDGAALRVLHSGSYIMGDDVQEFEEMFAAYIGTKYAVSVANGTDALEIALLSLGIGKGDEVITTAMSFFATAEAIAAVGATPVFVDCTGDTYTIDSTKIEEKISGRTKAIVPVHLYGQCADMDEINRIAKKHKLYVVEDAAQAAGAEYQGKKAGSLGTAGCFSFFPTKNLGCAGDGGIITTNEEAVYRKCRGFRVHGSGEDGRFIYCEKLGGVSEEIDFGKSLPKYFNFTIGKNSRLDTLQAALLKEKLPYLDGWNQKRRENAAQYGKEINNPLIKKPVCKAENGHIYYVYVLSVENRDGFREYMEANQIATGIYFPIPLHLQWCFKELGYKKGDMPNAEYLAGHGAAIPMFAELSEDERKKVIDVINGFGG